MRVRSTVAAHPIIFASALVAVLGLGIFVLAYFEPLRRWLHEQNQGEADVRTVVDTASLKPGTSVFCTILRTVSP